MKFSHLVRFTGVQEIQPLCIVSTSCQQELAMGLGSKVDRGAVAR